MNSDCFSNSIKIRAIAGVFTCLFIVIIAFSVGEKNTEKILLSSLQQLWINQTN